MSSHPLNICVVALGKIGLPLAVQYARRGHSVIGVDVQPSVVEHVNAGRAHFPGEEHLEDQLGDMVASARLRATADTASAVGQSDVVVVVVPLIVDDAKSPDFRAMDAATASIAAGLRPNTLVIYETTLPVGTTRSRFAPVLAAGSGLTLGVDLFVAFSPERVYSGRIFADLRQYPKLVGGVDDVSTDRAVSFYQQVLTFDPRPDLARANGVWNLHTAEAAELAKLAETTYRDINIAYANELARFGDRHGINVREVIDACNSQPFCHLHQPGIAVGGHCIPVYPHFYIAGDDQARLPAVAREVNDGMAVYAVDRLRERFGDLAGKTVAVLGAAYRGGVKETAFSGVFGVVSALEASGAKAVVHDPLYTDDELLDLGLMAYHLGERADAAIVQADHHDYATLSSDALGGAAVVVDGRNCVREHDGLQLIGLGVPPALEARR